MKSRILRVVEACLAVVFVVLATWCWNRGVHTSAFAPLAEGAPAFSSTHYSGSWIGGATALVIAAGLLAIDIARRRPSR